MFVTTESSSEVAVSLTSASLTFVCKLLTINDILYALHARLLCRDGMLGLARHSSCKYAARQMT